MLYLPLPLIQIKCLRDCKLTLIVIKKKLFKGSHLPYKYVIYYSITCLKTDFTNHESVIPYMWVPEPWGVIINQPMTFKPIVLNHSHVLIQSSPHGLSYFPKEWSRHPLGAVMMRILCHLSGGQAASSFTYWHQEPS